MGALLRYRKGTGGDGFEKCRVCMSVQRHIGWDTVTGVRAVGRWVGRLVVCVTARAYELQIIIWAYKPGWANT